MKSFASLACAVALLPSGAAFAVQGPVPKGIPALDHVFVIMMENHYYAQIADNPQAPFINTLMQRANVADNYHAIAHPSLTNYLQVVGGSNFNNFSDNSPDWHNHGCKPAITPGQAAITEASHAGPICPIAGTGTDAPVPAGLASKDHPDQSLPLIDGKVSIAARSDIDGLSIADQLVAAGRSWKSYQENLPAIGADGVNVSDGQYVIGSRNAKGQDVSSDFAALSKSGKPIDASKVVALYGVKHDPFAYFASVQEGARAALSLARVAPFDGPNGLFDDLKQGQAPDFAFIAPNQCNDMHGRNNAGAACQYDDDDNGSQTGLNPALIAQGDHTVQRIVTAIEASPLWNKSHSAIVLTWDENDSSPGNPNRVAAIVETSYGAGKRRSQRFYTHYSLTRTLDAAFGLPCLNHACDKDVETMSDLFAQ